MSCEPRDDTLARASGHIPAAAPAKKNKYSQARSCEWGQEKANPPHVPAFHWFSPGHGFEDLFTMGHSGLSVKGQSRKGKPTNLKQNKAKQKQKQKTGPSGTCLLSQYPGDTDRWISVSSRTAKSFRPARDTQ